MRAVEVETFHSAFIDQAIDLASDSNLSPWSRRGFEDHLSAENSISLQIQCDGKLVAFLVARFVPGQGVDPDAELLNIAVRHDAQRRGFGISLMSGFLRHCRKRSVAQVWLEVRMGNTAAVELYRSFGFEPVQVRKNFYSAPVEDAIIMRLTVGESESIKVNNA